MAKLTAEEEAQLKALQEKAETPDEPKRNGAAVNVTIDLGDPDQVRRGLKLGLLERGDLDEFDDPDPAADGGEEEEEEKPRRRARYD